MASGEVLIFMSSSYAGQPTFLVAFVVQITGSSDPDASIERARDVERQAVFRRSQKLEKLRVHHLAGGPPWFP